MLQYMKIMYSPCKEEEPQPQLRLWGCDSRSSWTLKKKKADVDCNCWIEVETDQGKEMGEDGKKRCCRLILNPQPNPATLTPKLWRRVVWTRLSIATAQQQSLMRLIKTDHDREPLSKGLVPATSPIVFQHICKRDVQHMWIMSLQ